MHRHKSLLKGGGTVKPLHFTLTLFGILFFFITAGYWYHGWMRARHAPVKIGILHSMTGPLAISEVPVIDAMLLAVEEINSQGGVLDRLVEPVVVDGQSKSSIFAQKAEELITQEQVAALFGCWASASRKTIKPIVEKHNILYFYPLQAEGLEVSPNIVYVGGTTNQIYVPAVEWCLENIGRRVFFVGTDYIFPQVVNAILKRAIAERGGTVVGEEYLPLDSIDVSGIVDAIVQSKPDFIVNSMSGEANVAFFKKLRGAGVTAEKVPTISYSISENELREIKLENVVGDYAAWNYFQSLGTPASEEFIRKFRRKYGSSRLVTSPIVTGYLSIHLWARAVQEAGSLKIDAVRNALKKLSIDAPLGTVHVDPNNQHVWVPARVGKINAEGEFDIVWDSHEALEPEPYPPYASKDEWEALLQQWYAAWGNRWERVE